MRRAQGMLSFVYTKQVITYYVCDYTHDDVYPTWPWRVGGRSASPASPSPSPRSR
jgi:hypothetical protein